MPDTATTTELGFDEATTASLDQLIQETETSLQKWTKTYEEQYNELNRKANTERGSSNGARDGAVAEIAEPLTVFFGVPYLWFDLIAVGPFQPIAPGGPFAPRRIIHAGEPAVLLAAIWRNPLPLPGGPNPSAAQIMAGQQFTVRGQTVNVNTVTNAFDLAPVSGTFGAGFINLIPLPIATLPAPPDLEPRLLDITLTVDVRSAGVGLPPFAGYASRWFQLDSHPPFLFPFIPGVGPVVVPGLTPGFVNDSPVRVLVYS